MSGIIVSIFDEGASLLDDSPPDELFAPAPPPAAAPPLDPDEEESASAFFFPSVCGLGPPSLLIDSEQAKQIEWLQTLQNVLTQDDA
jgi:hypothetical protein